jgi:hypothetical protein
MPWQEGSFFEKTGSAAGLEKFERIAKHSITRT